MPLLAPSPTTSDLLTPETLPWRLKPEGRRRRRRRQCSSWRIASFLPASLLCFALLACGLFPGGRAKHAVGGVGGVPFCSASTPLKTPYVLPFYETHLPVAGCVSPHYELSPSGMAVHVVRLKTQYREVLLTVTETSTRDFSRGLLLVLDSSTPVRWRLAFVGDVNRSADFKRVVVLSQDSTISSSNFDLASQFSLDDDLDRDSYAGRTLQRESDVTFIQRVRKRWKAITTLSKINGANRISIMMPETTTVKEAGEQAPPACNGVLTHSSPATMAYLVIQQPITGCYHAQMAGVSGAGTSNTRGDIHILDLHSSGSSSSLFYISLLPGVGFDAFEGRNVTLVLRSKRPVLWTLQLPPTSTPGARGLRKGHLHVITNSFVNVSSASPASSPPPMFTSSVDRRHLPDTFDELWTEVVHQVGPPMSYVRLNRVNVMSLIMPRKSPIGFSTMLKEKLNPYKNAGTKYDVPQNDLAEKTILIPGELLDAQQNQGKAAVKEMERDLRASATKTCSQVRTVVAVPRSVAKKYNVSQMTLNDKTCRAEMNSTHWVLRSPSTSCGSVNLFSGENPISRNNVIVGFGKDSPFYKKVVRIPFSCKFKPGLPGQGGDGMVEEEEEEDYDYDDDDYDYDYDDEELEGARSTGSGKATATGDIKTNKDLSSSSSLDQQQEMYQIRIQRLKQTLLKHPDESADVSLGDELRVETDFDTRSLLSLDLGRCWLSTRADADEMMGEGDILLIDDGCPAHNSNVTLLSEDGGGRGRGRNLGFGLGRANPAFSFRVTKRQLDMGRIYVMCLIGLCSPVESLASGNLGMCVDPATHCSASATPSPHQAPVAQQLTRRGPIFVHRQLHERPASQSPPLSPSHSTAENSYWKSDDVRMTMTASEPGIGGSKQQRSSSSSARESPGLHSSHVVMVGVPAEIAVIIALASFVIGAGLTGMLCYVHNKKTSPKVVRIRVNDPANMDGNELQSMINPTIPSSATTGGEGGGGGGGYAHHNGSDGNAGGHASLAC